MVIFGQQHLNIQQSIIEGIRLQLHRHSYVVLPGFGGFVLKQRPAHFTPAGTTLQPPSRTVSFNSQLKQNDGILAAWLVENNKLTASGALEQLHDFANYCRGVLDNRRRLSLPGIGFFYLDFENNLCFEPLADHNFLPESFGLTAVRVPVTAAALNPVNTVFKDRVHVRSETTSVPARRVTRVIAPALVAVLTVLVLALLLSVGNFRGQLRAALAGEGAERAYTPVVLGNLPLEKAAVNDHPLVSDANGVAMLRLPEVSLSVHTAASDNGVAAGQTRYEIVLGCFAVPQNASRLVRRMQSNHIGAQVLPLRHRGMQVVAYGQFPDKASALQQLERVRSHVPAAWIREAQ